MSELRWAQVPASCQVAYTIPTMDSKTLKRSTSLSFTGAPTRSGRSPRTYLKQQGIPPKEKVTVTHDEAVSRLRKAVAEIDRKAVAMRSSWASTPPNAVCGRGMHFPKHPFEAFRDEPSASAEPAAVCVSGRFGLSCQGLGHGEVTRMVVITFPDKETQKKALGFLLSRFYGKVFKSGEHIVPEAALGALAEQNFEFTVKGKANDSQVEEIRSALARPLQRRAKGSPKVARRGS